MWRHLDQVLITFVLSKRNGLIIVKGMNGESDGPTVVVKSLNGSMRVQLSAIGKNWERYRTGHLPLQA